MVQLAEFWASIDWLLTIQLVVLLVTALAATIALFLNWKATMNNTKTRELDIFYKVFQHIQDLQDKYYRDYASLSVDKQKDWLSIFFNALECVAFLIRRGHIRGDFMDFYKNSFITSYEDIFLSHASQPEKENAEIFKEMKALYKELKNRTSKPEL